MGWVQVLVCYDRFRKHGLRKLVHDKNKKMMSAKHLAKRQSRSSMWSSQDKGGGIDTAAMLASAVGYKSMRPPHYELEPRSDLSIRNPRLELSVAYTEWIGCHS